MRLMDERQQRQGWKTGEAGVEDRKARVKEKRSRDGRKKR